MKIRGTLIAIGIAILLSTATADEGLFLPDGSALAWPDPSNIITVLSTYFPNTPDYMHSVQTDRAKSVVVMFRLFTNEPLFVLAEGPNEAGPITPQDIEGFIDSFNLHAYFRSWRFTFDLQYTAIPEGLPDTYFLQTIGAPSDRITRVTAAGRYEIWRYASYGVSLEFLDSRIVAFTEP